jgi:hypothetical protein
VSSPAYDLPSVNLGFTSFMDGAPPSGPGFYITQYLQYYTSDEFKDSNGDDILPPFANEDLEAWISLTQFIYQSNTEVMLGAKWGIDVIVPYVGLDLTYGTYMPGFPQDNGSGIGDILVGPYLQWDPVMGPNGPKFMHRLEFQCLLPTGDYDPNKALNQGSNFFSFNPYWAATYFVNPKWTISTRIHYLWNGDNDEPHAAGVSESNAGQAFHLNFASAYEVLPGRLRVGINGYYLKQLTDTEYDGVDQPDSKEKVFAIGPGLLYSFNKDMHFFLNVFFENNAEMRPEGTRINLRYVAHF